jgi:hypothetical protein
VVWCGWTATAEAAASLVVVVVVVSLVLLLAVKVVSLGTPNAVSALAGHWRASQSPASEVCSVVEPGARVLELFDEVTREPRGGGRLLLSSAQRGEAHGGRGTTWFSSSILDTRGKATVVHFQTPSLSKRPPGRWPQRSQPQSRRCSSGRRRQNRRRRRGKAA